MQTGRKSSQFRYHAEAICTGSLAGHNAVRLMIGMPLLILPASIAVGDLIGYANEKSATREGRMNIYFCWSWIFKENGTIRSLYY